MVSFVGFLVSKLPASRAFLTFQQLLAQAQSRRSMEKGIRLWERMYSICYSHIVPKQGKQLSSGEIQKHSMPSHGTEEGENSAG